MSVELPVVVEAKPVGITGSGVRPYGFVYSEVGHFYRREDVVRERSEREAREKVIAKLLTCHWVELSREVRMDFVAWCNGGWEAPPIKEFEPERPLTLEEFIEYKNAFKAAYGL